MSTLIKNMFLALIIPAFLSPCIVPTVECEIVKNRLNLANFGNRSLAVQNILLSPVESVGTLEKLYFLHSEFPDLLQSPNDLTREYKNETKKGVHNSDLSKRNVPVVRVPRVHSNDYGQSSHYRMKESRNEYLDSTKKNFYLSLLQKLLRPRYSGLSRKGKDHYDSSKYSTPAHISSSPMEVAAGGWGWSGWSDKGHGHGLSLLDAILCGLSLLSLGGFLLNLLLNLLNMFGFGMTTSTSTYPVTVTQTQTATSTATGGGGGGGTAITYPTALSAPLIGSGWGITGRTIDSMAGNGWRSDGTKAVLKGHVKLGGSKAKEEKWPSTTTTTTEPPLTYPTLTGTGGTAAQILLTGRKKRPKREIFQPYVNPSTALNTFAKAILNSIDAATHKYECIEKVYCENNKQARVIGQWLDYFMPVYSFSLSYFGHRAGAHKRLIDHIRAIVLGVTETNCQAHFPRCGKQ